MKQTPALKNHYKPANICTTMKFGYAAHQTVPSTKTKCASQNAYSSVLPLLPPKLLRAISLSVARASSALIPSELVFNPLKIGRGQTASECRGGEIRTCFRFAEL